MNCYKTKNGVLYLTHDAGFFSNLSVALWACDDYHNQTGELPKRLDFSESYQYFKAGNVDTYPDWFRRRRPHEYVPPRDPIPAGDDAIYTRQLVEDAAPLVRMFFGPSLVIRSRVDRLRQIYKWDPENTLVVCYRGTDKRTEVNTGSYQQFGDKAQAILKRKPWLRLFVQTDEAGFLQYCHDRFDRVEFIKELPTTTRRFAVHHQIPAIDRAHWSASLLASVLMLSDCRHLVTHTGNVSRWLCLYRGNVEGVIQFRAGGWRNLGLA